jgi:capsular exopolysaccharide synthesis family protein
MEDKNKPKNKLKNLAVKTAAKAGATLKNISNNKQALDALEKFQQSIENPHLRNYFDILLRRREIIVTFFVTVVLLVGIGSFIIRPVYRATATLLIDVESPNILTASGSVAMGSENYYTYKEYFQSQMEIITSRPIARQVFNELGLGNARAYRRAKDPIKSFLKSITVEPVRDTRLLKLHVENKDPVLAEKTANLMARTYVMRNLAYISKNELLNLLKNEYLKLQTKLSEYNKIYKDEHPEMIKLRQEIAELVKKIQQENEAVPIGEGGEGDSGKQDVFRGLKANNISIVSPAEVPVNPVRPKKRLNLLIALIVGAFGGVGLAFLFEYLDDTVKGVEEIESSADVAILGNIPEIDPDDTMGEKEKDIITHIKPKDPISEAFKTFRTNITMLSTQEHPIKSLLITSPGPSEGKTFSACNLAIAMAQNNKRVLLVDADMRRPRLNSILDKENKTGLSAFLCGQAKFESVIQETQVENLSFVSGGPIPPNPSELLDTKRMKEFIALAAAKFDFLIFDTPPIAIIADAIIISRLVDGMVMVVEIGKTSRRAFARVSKVARDIKARLLGVFLNKISPNAANHYYYAAYYTHYSQQQDKPAPL